MRVAEREICAPCASTRPWARGGLLRVFGHAPGAMYRAGSMSTHARTTLADRAQPPHDRGAGRPRGRPRWTVNWQPIRARVCCAAIYLRFRRGRGCRYSMCTVTACSVLPTRWQVTMTYMPFRTAARGTICVFTFTTVERVI